MNIGLLVGAIEAQKRCVKQGNEEWEEKWEEVIKEEVGKLPHGGGIDGEWKVDRERTNGKRVVMHGSYHAMDTYGMYDRWIYFRVTIEASFEMWYDIKIVGNFGKYQDVKEYLYDTLQHVIEVNKKWEDEKWKEERKKK